MATIFFFMLLVIYTFHCSNSIPSQIASCCILVKHGCERYTIRNICRNPMVIGIGGRILCFFVRIYVGMRFDFFRKVVIASISKSMVMNHDKVCYSWYHLE